MGTQFYSVHVPEICILLGPSDEGQAARARRLSWPLGLLRTARSQHLLFGELSAVHLELLKLRGDAPDHSHTRVLSSAGAAGGAALLRECAVQSG